MIKWQKAWYNMKIRIKRIYEPWEEGDGFRALVDRLWPRGISKEKARLDLWLKEAAPSPELRTWFGHREENFEAFANLYRKELDSDPVKREAVCKLLAVEGPLTLLYAAKDTAVNHAAVLREYLNDHSKEACQ